MSDILAGHECHTTDDGPEGELGELRRRLADAEVRAMNAAAAEDAAQFAFETAKRRGDYAEAALRQCLIERITPSLPKDLEDFAEGLADSLVDDITVGTLLDDIDVDGHVASWLQDRTGGLPDLDGGETSA